MVVLIVSFAFAFGCAMYDNDKRFDNHASRWVFRAIVAVLASYLMGDFVMSLALFATTFYLFFDGLLNILEERDFFSIGKTSIIDKVAGAIFNKYIYFIFKLLIWGLSLFIDLILLTFKL